MKICIIAGARPNFIKIAPIIHAIHRAQKTGAKIQYRLVHTGQHYDTKMSDSFFRDLEIPHPHINLHCGGGSQAEQTAAIMVAFEKELLANPADIVLVVGDVTSTMACAIVAKKLNTKVAHVEAGIRSFDLSMPEEINRMVTDSITDYFFTTSEFANKNLEKTGVNKSNIFFVGNVMIDTLLANEAKLRKPSIFDSLQLHPHQYFVVTLHRPSNVDDEINLRVIISEIVNNVEGLPVIFPMHPRTAKAFSKDCFQYSNLKVIEPLGYLEFNYLVKQAKAIITDSGGITEETTVMGVPCLTLRDNTERPETIEIGTNELVGTRVESIRKYLSILLKNQWKKGAIPYLWDGKTATRIIDKFLKIYENISN